MTEGVENRRVTTFPLVGAPDSEAVALTAVIRRLASAHSLAEVMEIVTHAARVILTADGITFVLRDGDRCYYAEEDAISPLWKGHRFPMSACISGWCMEHGRSVAIPDIYEDERIPHHAYRPTFVKSLAMVPVRQQEPIAALGAYWAAPHEATAAELEVLQTIANAAALSIAYVQRCAVRPAPWARLASALSAKLRAPSLPWPHPGRQVSLGLALALAAFLVRLPLDPVLSDQVPYATFYAAVVLGVIWGGWVAGLTALVAGGLAANFAIVEPGGALAFTTPRLAALLVYALVSAVLLVVTNGLDATTRREKELNSRLQLVRGELQHRIKNLIAVAQAIAIQTQRSSAQAGDFDANLTKRLQALAGAQSLLDDVTQSTAGLSLLIERILAPFKVGQRVAVSGPPELRVAEDVAVGLALILNELATNALKYGALSDREGSVSIACTQLGDRAHIAWQERGGPPVSPPSGKGFGTRLIRSALPKGSGTAEVDYRPEGVCCTIDVVCVTQLR